MLRSRLLSINQPLFQRTVVTNAKTIINNNGSNEEDKVQNQRNVIEGYQLTNTSYKPPRRPLTHQFTHQVTNQVPPLESVDLYESDMTLKRIYYNRKLWKNERNGSRIRYFSLV